MNALEKIHMAKMAVTLVKNLPELKETFANEILPQVHGSIKKAENQQLAFGMLYDFIPDSLKRIVNEEMFVEFCMNHSEKFIGVDYSDSIKEIEDGEFEVNDDDNLPMNINSFFVADEILKLKELLDIDAISKAEFEEKKKELVNIF